MAFEEGPAEPLIGGGFDVVFFTAFAAVGLVLLIGFAFVGYTVYRSYRAAQRAGLDPFTSEAQVISQAIGGSQLSVEQRLQQLDDLHRRGVISAEEHRTARGRVLAGG